MKDWSFGFGFGPHLELYAPTARRVDTRRAPVAISGARFVAHPTMDFYRFWARTPRDVFRFIDEPTNRFFVEAENKGGFAVGYELFHPKIVLATPVSFLSKL